MKKLLFLFLIGQLFLLSYIFNKSVYDIYELNNLGDQSLDAYIIEGFSGNELNALYSDFESQCLAEDGCALQLIKTPVSSNQTFIYEVYHSQVQDIHKPKSISADTTFTYHPLEKEDFIDSNGVFYTDLSFQDVTRSAEAVGVTIEPYENNIAYNQIVKNNALNFAILLILTQLVLFIYTFTRIKINAIKKMLGFSKSRMVAASLTEFIKMEIIIFFVIVTLHAIFYLVSSTFVLRYFILLSLFLLFIIFINIILLLITQISLRYIDIHLMVKNKVYSNRSNIALYTTKIVLMISITLSVSAFIETYQDYQQKSQDLEQYRQLEGFFTSNGYNYAEDTKARMDLQLIEEYGASIKNMYDQFDQQEELYVNDAYVLELLSPGYLEMQGLRKEDILGSITENFIVANERYVNRFMSLKDADGNQIENLQSENPTILVPEKYQPQESEVKEFYIEHYNLLLNYNEFFGLDQNEQQTITNLDIIYLANDQEYELLGQTVPGSEESQSMLKDTIILIDHGNFDSLYYYDLLNRGDLYFQLDSREVFNQSLAQNGLSSLVNAGTLLTPYMDRLHFTEFIMDHLLVFSVLFLLTLLFIIYISNYVDIVSNSRKYAMQYIHGFSFIKIFKSHFTIWIILTLAVMLKLFVAFNVLFYVGVLFLDFVVLLYLYRKIISKNVDQVIKGG
ncbi:hypothetical protein [Jeotgalibacillus aurantiacus]|uniref:hypothetical protein n=1 Tax=Jeotgalibacillus aurantiacus TaxID=2763266 RepID=UPI001D0AB514|nr:hypothetical protein [Jeotgalibacillus aurantiacus]